MRVGLVCEGQTDVPVFEALLDRLLPHGWILHPLQPEQDKLGAWTNAGWTKVRDYCLMWGPVLAYLPTPVDILIVQVDGDIRGQVGVADNEALCAEIRRWLGPGSKFPGLIIAIPTLATETWLLAANRPVTPAVETQIKPADQLVRAGLLACDPHGDPVKDSERYRELAGPLGNRLDSLRQQLRELQRFCAKLEELLTKRTLDSDDSRRS